MSLDKLGRQLVRQDDGGAEAVADQTTKILLQAMLVELKFIKLYLAEMSGLELEERDL
jgi:hypothetical protein